MKIIHFPLYIYLSLIIFSSINSFGQNELKNYKYSTDSSFGFTPENPLKMKNGNLERSIKNTYDFLSNLKTIDNQDLLLLSRRPLNNPNYKQPKVSLNNRFTGVPIRGNLGILDKYIFLTSKTKDTITLFVDVYKKGKQFVPVGLKYDAPQK